MVYMSLGTIRRTIRFSYLVCLFNFRFLKLSVLFACSLSLVLVHIQMTPTPVLPDDCYRLLGADGGYSPHQGKNKRIMQRKENWPFLGVWLNSRSVCLLDLVVRQLWMPNEDLRYADADGRASGPQPIEHSGKPAANRFKH